jgi:hypothetical protein
MSEQTGREHVEGLVPIEERVRELPEPGLRVVG